MNPWVIVVTEEAASYGEEGMSVRSDPGFVIGPFPTDFDCGEYYSKMRLGIFQDAYMVELRAP